MFLDAIHGCVSCMMFTMVEVTEPPQRVRNVSTYRDAFSPTSQIFARRRIFGCSFKYGFPS